MKLSDYISSLGNAAFIPIDFSRDYLDDYRANHTRFDLMTKVKYGNLPLITDVSAEMKSLILSVCYSHDYEWKTLYNTTILEYNPIWNVDGTEVTTRNTGEKSETNVYGEKTQTNAYGERKSSGTDDNYVIPFDDTHLKETGKIETDNTQDAVTDTITDAARTDTKTNAASVDSETLVRSGNIGVTSTQNLLNQERDVAYFNFINIIIDEIVKDITIPIWADCDFDYNESSSGTDDYNELKNKPSINGVTLEGNKTGADLNLGGSGTDDYNDLINKPAINGKTLMGDIEFEYDDLKDKPTLFSGNYEDLNNKPRLFSGNYEDLSNKPTLFSGNYEDLSNKPTIPTDASEISYDNSFSGLSADNVEMAIDEVSHTNDIQNAAFDAIGRTANLLNPTFQSQVVNGVIITNNGDGSYTFNGTASSEFFVTVGKIAKADDKQYKLLGCQNGSSTTYMLGANTYSDSRLLGSDYGDGIVLNNTEGFHIYIYIYSGCVFNNTVFRPMLTSNLQATIDDFVAFTGTTGKLNSDVAEIKKDLSESAKMGYFESYFSDGKTTYDMTTLLNKYNWTRLKYAICQLNSSTISDVVIRSTDINITSLTCVMNRSDFSGLSGIFVLFVGE